MKVVVGLGNPGEKYDLTRHNIGFMVVDALAEQAQRPIKLAECESLTGRVTLAGEPVLLVKPRTYMNLSGQAVARVCEKYDADPRQDVLIVVDDIALPFGKLRLRAKGSAGSHNGLKSIIERLRTQEFARLRVGIQPDHPIGDLADFVLAKFSPRERQHLDTVMIRVREAIELWMTAGIEPAMAQVNG